jgi:hypothetical protein
LAEDEDIEQDSEEYRKWRQGDDNEQYASSRTPTETGASSGEYKIPTSTDTPTTSQGNDGSENIFWVGIAVAVLLVLGSGIMGIYLFMSNAEDVASWPTTEGSVSETYYTDGWVEECDDADDDGDEDDWECHDVFWCKIDVSYNFTVEAKKYFSSEEGIDGNYGEDTCQTELENKYQINGPVKVHYDPENPAINYIENPPSSGLAMAFCAMPFCTIIFVVMAFAAMGRITGHSDPFSRGFAHRGWNRRRGFGFGGFGRRGGRSRRSGGARRRTTRTRSRRR